MTNAMRLFRMNAGRLTRYLLTICLLLYGYASNAQDGGVPQPWISCHLTGSTDLVVSGNIPLTYTPAADEATPFIQNIVSLNVVEESTVFIPAAFTAKVSVTIYYGANSSTTTSINQDLTVTYAPGSGVKYNAKNYVSFNNAQYVKVVITAFDTTAVGSGFSIRSVLSLENEMRVKKYFILGNNILPTITATTPATSPIPDALPVSWTWPPDPGNNESQLEWTWVENDVAATYLKSGSIDYDLVFKNNATRVDLPLNMLSYNIPLFYSDSGLLYYRVRAVNTGSLGNPAYGPWSDVQSYSFGGHNDSLNWQASTSFAEEGKLKSVLQYYDGSLRMRQTVTKDNSTNTTLSAETFYDGQGRPAIQILPAPGISSIVSYTHNLNVFNGQPVTGTAYDNPAASFDLTPAPSSLNIVSGAALYYSALNPEITSDSLNPKLPDGQGYPFSLTRYTPDATGRIMSQSGVGYYLKTGTNHETDYYYGNAAQLELNALFGTEAGYASHYFKNMVKDANGQMSVSYVDMHGRTVATALAGGAPGRMLGLDMTQYPGQTGTTITRNLLDSGANTVRNDALESLTSLLIPVTEPYTFSYQLTAASLQLPQCSSPTNVCYDCMYDLEISVTDESGVQPPIVRKFSNVSLSADDNCSTPAQTLADQHYGTSVSTVSGNSISFTETLLPGSYSVRKTLTVSEASLQRYEAIYLQKGLCKTQQQIIDSLYTNVLLPTSSCKAPPDTAACQSCLDSLGDLTHFTTKYNANLAAAAPDSVVKAAYQAAFTQCSGMCSTISHKLETLKYLMLSDMTPFTGQYAQDPTAPVIPIGSMYYAYDIFSTATPAIQPFYKHPEDSLTNAAKYRDLAGNVDSTLYSAAHPALLQSLSPQGFDSLFVSSWADSLLPHHPEYGRLLFAQQHLSSSYDWIDRFNSISSYSTASTTYSMTNGEFENADPFFSLTGTSADKTKMDSIVFGHKYYNGLSLWQIAYGNVGCNATYIGGSSLDNCYTSAPVQPPYSSLTTAQMNQVWSVFQGLYSSVRDSMVNAYIKANSPLTNEDALVTAGYILRFPTSTSQVIAQYNWTGFPTTPGAAPTVNMNDSVAAIDTSRCGSYIYHWKQELSQCPALAGRSDSAQILTEITNSMRTVCEKGLDAANPYGSSTVAPGTPTDLSARSFAESVDSVFGVHGLTHSQYCNPFVIEDPKPYNKGPLITKEYISALDTCTCRQFALIQTQATAASYDPLNLTSMNQYLRSVSYDTLTQVLFDGLQKCSLMGDTLCRQIGVHDTTLSIWYADPCLGITSHHVILPTDSTTTTSCPIDSCTTIWYIPLASGQPKPRFLDCGFAPDTACVTCARLSALTAGYKTYFSGQACAAAPIINSDTLTADQVSYNITWAQYINYYTGLQLDWATYTRAASGSSCNLANYTSNSGATQSVVCASTLPLTDTTGYLVHDSACQHTYEQAIAWGTALYQQQQAQLLANFEAQYRAKCLSSAGLEQFAVQYTNSEYHYTLYYYDLAGNLVKTVPPKGARPNFASTFSDSVNNARIAGTIKVPAHVLITHYLYNSLNEVIAQTSPDAHTSHFWYDILGRLAVSQNAQQNFDGKYSYTLYDPIGRITEVGQLPQSTAMTQTISQDPTGLTTWITANTREQITSTVYDVAAGSSGDLTAGLMTQNNLRNRVSYTYTKNSSTDVNWYTGTYYTYDIHGNVDTLVQDYLGITSLGSNHFKRICYNYDLISGKVNGVDYQSGNSDTYYHRYFYDAENRITETLTSRDSVIWERDAKYSYYKHGPLSRSLLGKLQVQALDYSYTLQGWLKGVNLGGGAASADSAGYGVGNSGDSCGSGTALENAVVSSRAPSDPATYYALNSVSFTGEFTMNDGDAFETDIDPALATCTITGSGGGSPSLPQVYPVAQDVYNFSLHYYPGDYQPIGGAVIVPTVLEPLNVQAAPLYNGNIAAMAVSIPKLGPPRVYNYHYDQLNRIGQMDAYNGLNNSTGVFVPTQLSDYMERANYDPNGNILAYQRNGYPATGQQIPMDSLHYTYYPNTNQLQRIKDTVSAGKYSVDIDDQGTGSNYTYDSIGNLKTDVAAGLTSVTWTVYGKIASITNGSGTIYYTYDAAGNRITKTYNDTLTLYVRDAQGNVMSVYRQPTGGGTVQQTETHLYGSSRLGLTGPLTAAPTPVSMGSGYGVPMLGTFTRGEKVFELSNHLGNVLATITDKKIAVSSTSNSSLIDHYLADQLSAQDYYPFGMEMPGRVYNNGGYRYGFNGKENDNEVKGVAEQIDYGARVYDPRVGKFLSVDPLTGKYPELTPYQFASNKPIAGVDLDGREILGFGYLVDELAKGASKLGLQRTAGFISSYGHSLVVDPIYSSNSVLNTAKQGNVVGTIKQFDPTGITSLPDIYKTGKAAANGDPYAQGEILGMLPGAAGAVITFRAAKADLSVPSSSPSPEGNTSQQTTAIHGNAESGGADPVGNMDPIQPVQTGNEVPKSKTARWVEAGVVSPDLVKRYNRLNKTPRPYQNFTRAGKSVVRDINREVNGGIEICVYCGIPTIDPKQSTLGVTPPLEESNIDHVDRRVEGGSGTPNNGDNSCRNCNVNLKH